MFTGRSADKNTWEPHVVHGYVSTRGLRLLPGYSVDLFKPTALAKRLVVNSIVLMNRQQRPPPPPEAFPEPFAKSRSANRTPNAAGADYTYLQAGPPPGNIHAPRGEISYITPAWCAR